jgi:F-type H+-transporting ATPase subunit b
VRTLATAILVFLSTAAAAFAASHGGGEQTTGLPWGEILKQAVNFGILIGVLVYFLRKPLSNLLKERRELLIKSMEEAREASEEARKNLEKMEKKLTSLEDEVKILNRSMEEDAEKEAERKRSLTVKEIERIKEQAAFAAEQELKKAKQELRKEAAELSVKTAAEIISNSINEEDQKRFIKENIEKIKEVQK